MYHVMGTCNVNNYCGYIEDGFRTRQACTGMEKNLTECGGIQVDNFCHCGSISVFTCQPIATGKTGQ